MDNEDRNIQFGNNDSIKMSIPERIGNYEFFFVIFVLAFI